MIRRTLAAAAAAGVLLLASACAGDDLSAVDPSGSGSDKGALTISGQNWGEATLVANMYAELLTASGYDVSMTLVDTRDVYMARGQFPGAVDVVPEYVGSLLDFLNARANGPSADPVTTADAAESIAAGRSLLDDAGITLLDPSTASDTNGFFVTQDYSDANGVTRLSDLEGKDIVLAGHSDCKGRADCEGGLSDVYGINITQLVPLGYGSAATYQAVIDGEAQLGETSTTDGTLAAQGLVLLEDDRHIQPAQNLVPAVASDFLAAHPDVADTLNALMVALTTEKLAELNARVSVDREKSEDVAHDFLEGAGLL